LQARLHPSDKDLSPGTPRFSRFTARAKQSLRFARSLRALQSWVDVALYGQDKQDFSGEFSAFDKWNSFP
jgi:hypothetical protein